MLCLALLSGFRQLPRPPNLATRAVAPRVSLATPNEATLNCLLLVSYDGSFSKGSCYNRNDPVQAGQPNATVEGLLEVALDAVLPHPNYICLASRTDKGVSARMNYGVGFMQALPAENFRPWSDKMVNDTNTWLRENGFGLRLCDLRPLPQKFRVRWPSRGMVCDAMTERKRYKYFITHGGRAPECSHDGSEDCQPWHLKEVLNVSAMQESAGAFVGEHDFHTFTSQHGLQRNATRRILHVGVEKVAAATNTLPELLCVSILGESFLYRMVRYIVFALVLAGRHRPGATAAGYRRLLAPSASRSAKRKQKQQLGLGPAPARGLQLAEVYLSRRMDMGVS